MILETAEGTPFQIQYVDPTLSDANAWGIRILGTGIVMPNGIWSCSLIIMKIWFAAYSSAWLPRQLLGEHDLFDFGRDHQECTGLHHIEWLATKFEHRTLAYYSSPRNLYMLKYLGLEVLSLEEQFCSDART